MTFEERLKDSVLWIETLGNLITFLVMIGCMIFGMLQIGMGFKDVLFAHSLSGKELIDPVLTGLEMFFLAPLPFFAIRSMAGLVGALIGNNRERIKEGESRVVDVKRLITGLMIAVLATELIHRIIKEGDLEVKSIAAILGLIAVLNGYYWVSLPPSHANEELLFPGRQTGHNLLARRHTGRNAMKRFTRRAT